MILISLAISNTTDLAIITVKNVVYILSRQGYLQALQSRENRIIIYKNSCSGKNMILSFTTCIDNG